MGDQTSFNQIYNLQTGFMPQQSIDSDCVCVWYVEVHFELLYVAI